MGQREDTAYSRPPSKAVRDGQGERTNRIPDSLVCRAGAVQSEERPDPMDSIPTRNSLTGEPDAGERPVRFGGRGGANPAIPTPINSPMLQHWERVAIGTSPEEGVKKFIF